MKTVIVYSTQMCPYCKLVKEWLRTHSIPYKDFDVGADSKASEEMIAKSGQMGVPVIDIDGAIILGFDQKEMEKRLI